MVEPFSRSSLHVLVRAGAARPARPHVTRREPPSLGRKAACSDPHTDPHIVAAPPGPKGKSKRFAEPCWARLYAAGRVGVHAYGQACRRMREVRRPDSEAHPAFSAIPGASQETFTPVMDAAPSRLFPCNDSRTGLLVYAFTPCTLGVKE